MGTWSDCNLSAPTTSLAFFVITYTFGCEWIDHLLYEGVTSALRINPIFRHLRTSKKKTGSEKLFEKPKHIVSPKVFVICHANGKSSLVAIKHLKRNHHNQTTENCSIYLTRTALSDGTVPVRNSLISIDDQHMWDHSSKKLPSRFRNGRKERKEKNGIQMT